MQTITNILNRGCTYTGCFSVVSAAGVQLGSEFMLDTWEKQLEGGRTYFAYDLRVFSGTQLLGILSWDKMRQVHVCVCACARACACVYVCMGVVCFMCVCVAPIHGRQETESEEGLRPDRCAPTDFFQLGSTACAFWNLSE